MWSEDDDLLSRRNFLVGATSLLLTSLADGAARGQAMPSGRAFAYVGSISASKAVLPDSGVGSGKGIYLFEADLATGTLTYKGVTSNAANPWWINAVEQVRYKARRLTTQRQAELALFARGQLAPCRTFSISSTPREI